MSRFFGLVALVALLFVSGVSGQTCGGAGYDLSSLTGQQFSTYSGGYIWSLSPCGVVTNTTACPNPNFANTMFCQTYPGYNGTSLAQYSAANSSWGVPLNGNGVVQTIQDGTFCAAEGGANGGNYRETTINYMCVQSASTPYLINVTESHTCYYTAYIATSAACSRTSNAGTGPLAPVGTQYYDSRCGGGAYDLSPLSGSDLMWASSGANTRTWYLRVCGSVTSANCSATAGEGGAGIPSTQYAMLCQSDPNNIGGDTYSAAFNVPALQQWTIPSLSGGLTMSIQDGQSCGSFNRETTINFVCNSGATTAQLTNVVEVSTCYYTATVQTNLVCPQYLQIGSSSTGAATPVTPVASSSGSVSPAGPNTGAASSTSTVSAMVAAAVLAVVALLL